MAIRWCHTIPPPFFYYFYLGQTNLHSDRRKHLLNELNQCLRWGLSYKHLPGPEGSCQELTNTRDSRAAETKFNRRKEEVWSEDLGFLYSPDEMLPYVAKTL